MTLTPGHQSLNDFYESVKFSNPRIAALMHADIKQVAIFAVAQDKTPARDSAKHLREVARENDLPEIHCRALENALTELGFE